VLVGGSVSVGFTIQNPNASLLTNVSFTDALSGLAVASPNGVASSCAALTATSAVPGSTSITVSGSLDPSETCDVFVAVTGTSAGSHDNTTSPIGSTETGPGSASNTATIEVLLPVDLTKAFLPTSVALLGSSTLTFTVTNPNAVSQTHNNGLTEIGFDDFLPAGLQISAPDGLLNDCVAPTSGVTSDASVNATAGGTSISVLGLGLDPGASCTISVSVTATTLGSKVNTTTAPTFAFDAGEPAGGSGAPATDTLDVQGIDVSIGKTHVGTFTQGDVGRAFTITVTNVGTQPTSGTLTVTDTLPAGLTPTAISGTGWTCLSPPALSCSRADALAPAASYPAITLTVDVSPAAASPLVNTATVSGGGDIDPANNTANDTVTVGAAPPPAAVIPTLDGAGLAALCAALAAAGWAVQRRRLAARRP
jgi:uncharacterized repeat protein (TIGR01451 family)